MYREVKRQKTSESAVKINRSERYYMQEDTNQPVVVQPAEPEFTPVQKEYIEGLMQERLARQAANHNSDLENVRAEARRQVGLQSHSTAEHYVEHERNQAARKAATRAGLSTLFGPTSDANKATALYKSDKALYDALRAEAVKLGLLPK